MKLKSWHIAALIVCAAIMGFILLRSYQQEQGRQAFMRLGCANCHLAGGAPSLEGVGRKYTREQFIEWVGNPDVVYQRVGKKPINAGYQPMPRLKATHDELVSLSYFLAAHQ
jgi:hypothetical protein